MEKSTTRAFPSISELLSSSWAVFKKSLTSIFILYLIACAVSFALVLAFIIIVVVTGIGAGLTNVWQNPATALPLILTASGFFIFLLAGFMAVGALIQVGMVLVIDSGGTASIDTILKKSIRLIIPLGITGFLSGLIALGGFFLLVIPGIVFCYLMLFTQYEVILQNRRGMAAIKRSVFIVKSHFWEILLRIAVIIGIEIFLTILPIFSAQDEALMNTINVVLIFVRILFGWYTAVYFLLLYKAAEKAAPADKEASLTLISILSILGWLLAVLSLIFIIKAFSTLSANFFNRSEKYKQNEYYQQDPNKVYPPTEDRMYQYPSVPQQYQ